MEDFNDIVDVAVDGYRGNVQQYSVAQSQELMHEALVEANSGSDKLDLRAMRDGASNGLFTLIETILARTTVEGLQGDEFFMNMVEPRNIALGDLNRFLVEDSNLFYVDEIAAGTQGIRRQRLSGMTEVEIKTSVKAVKFYEELQLVLAGRVDLNHFINRVGASFQAQILNDIYALWSSATAENMGGEVYFPAAGTYDEDVLLETIAHVEAAANGRTATLVGTKKALRNLKNSMDSIDAANDINRLGYMGSFYGNPVVAIPQRHKINSTEFVMNDNSITIIASADDKPIKLVNEGNPLIIPSTQFANGDMTQEYSLIQSYGVGIVLAGGNSGIGRYEIAA